MKTPVKIKVVCEICRDDYSHRDDKGGMLFNHSFICPYCKIVLEDKIERYNEQHYIRALAIEGETFTNFVKRMIFYNYNTLN